MRVINRRCRLPVRRWRDNGVVSLQHDLERLFEDGFPFFNLGPVWGRDTSAVTPAAFTPHIDVSETDKDVTVSAELPGLDKADVSVEIDEDTLTIRGEKKEEDEGKIWRFREQSYGSFERVIRLPATVDRDGAKATFRKGILSVTLPKLEEEKPATRALDIEDA